MFSVSTKNALGIIGPTDIDKYCRQIKIPKKTYLDKIKRIAKKIASKQFEIIITPDKKSSVECFTKTYRNNKGPRTTGIFPLRDTEFGYGFLNQRICDEIENCGTWAEQETRIVKRSQNLLCLGFSRGVIIEICKTGPYWKKRKNSKVFIIKDFIKQKLSDFIAEGLSLQYVSIQDVEKK